MRRINRKSCVYVIPFKINNWQLPLRVQVSYAKDYAEINKLNFSLPKSELLFSREYNTLKLLLENGYSEFIIFSEILIAHENSLMILKSWSENIKEKNIFKPLFHFTYSEETIEIDKLILRIEKIIRNKKYAMSFENLENLRRNNRFS